MRRELIDFTEELPRNVGTGDAVLQVRITRHVVQRQQSIVDADLHQISEEGLHVDPLRKVMIGILQLETKPISITFPIHLRNLSAYSPSNWTAKSVVASAAPGRL